MWNRDQHRLCLLTRPNLQILVRKLTADVVFNRFGRLCGDVERSKYVANNLVLFRRVQSRPTQVLTQLKLISLS